MINFFLQILHVEYPLKKILLEMFWFINKIVTYFKKYGKKPDKLQKTTANLQEIQQPFI